MPAGFPRKLSFALSALGGASHSLIKQMQNHYRNGNLLIAYFFTKFSSYSSNATIIRLSKLYSKIILVTEIHEKIYLIKLEFGGLQSQTVSACKILEIVGQEISTIGTANLSYNNATKKLIIVGATH